jgi:DNA-binding transcriptional ArsR family regulator
LTENPQRYDVFQAIADPTRRKLLELLLNDEVSISTISSHFPMSRTAVTKHLRVLESAGLTRPQKVGREKLYKLESQPLQKLQTWIEFFNPYWETKLLDLKRIVENELSEE